MVSQDPVFFLAPKREIPNQCPINQKGRTPTNPANTKPSLFPSEMKLNKMTKAGKEKIPTNTPPQAKANTIGKDTLVSRVLWIHLPAPLFIKDDMIHMWVPYSSKMLWIHMWAPLFIKNDMIHMWAPIIHRRHLNWPMLTDMYKQQTYGPTKAQTGVAHPKMIHTNNKLRLHRQKIRGSSV